MEKGLVLQLVIAVVLFVTAQDGWSDTCITLGCHRPIGVMRNLHKPVKDGDKCFSCHIRFAKIHPDMQKAHKLIAEKDALCAKCHKTFGSMKIVHLPVKQGECTSCHNPHGSDGRKLLDITENETTLCVKCHDPSPFKQKYMHGPVAVGACGKCHDPHEASNRALLRESPRDNCLKCHADFAQAMAKSAMVHRPVANDSCTACHDPHGSPHQSMLKNSMKELCLGCHTAFAKKISKIKDLHKPLLQPESCASCHAAHYSAGKALLPGDEKGVCLGCHNRELGPSKLRNIKKDLEGKKMLHGPIQRGECKACHDPHGSGNFRLLKGTYPSEIYVPYRDGLYGACLNCHEKNLLRYAETTVFTQFRNGKRNLHYVHVAHKRKGRTCRVCHEPHASNGDKLINKESLQFGEWRIPVNLTLTPTGGSCAPGCHREFKYDREIPEKY